MQKRRPQPISSVLLALIALIAVPARAQTREKSRVSAVAAIRGPGPGVVRPECGANPPDLLCLNEAIATAPSCDGFFGDPMFLWVNHRGGAVVYCRRQSPPPDDKAWRAAHPETCRPGETLHSCPMTVSWGKTKGACPDYDGNADYYRVYPRTPLGGHRGLEPREGEFMPYGGDTPVEHFYCRSLQAIRRDEDAARRREDEAFRRDLTRKAGAALVLLAVVWALSRSHKRKKRK